MLVGESGVNTFSYLEYQASDGTSEVFVLDADAPAVSGGIVTLVGTDKNDKLKLGYDSNPGDLKGLAGDDRLYGGQSDDYLDGGTGDDYLTGNSGEDTLSGGEGEDYLEGGLGSDYLAGGAGDDVYVIEVNYGSFFDYAGWDNVDTTLDPSNPLYENTWDYTVGNVDTINDADGADRLIIITPPSSEDPFDQYHETILIDENGNLNLNWIVETASSNAYQWSLTPGYEHDPISDTAANFWMYGAAMPVQANGKSGAYDQFELVFTSQGNAEAWLLEQFGPQLHSTWGEVENQSDYSKYIKVYNPAKNLKAGVNEYGVGKDAKGVDIDLKSESYVYSFDTEALQADGIIVQTKFSSLVDLQTAYPNTVSANDVFVKHLMYNEYVPAVNLSNLQSAGYHLDFDLYKVETWPGFSDLPKATDTNSPEVGTQEYWSANFDISVLRQLCQICGPRVKTATHG